MESLTALLAAGLGTGLLVKAGNAASSSASDHERSVPRINAEATKMKFLPRTKKIEGIVVHHTHTSSPEATARVLVQRGFSTNFEVDQKGNVIMYGDPSKWEAQATGGGANAHTIGIDLTHVGLTAPFPDAQIAALRSLVHQLASTYGFKVAVAPDGQRGKWADWAGKGYTVFRHRNFVATACPANLPLEKVA